MLNEALRYLKLGWSVIPTCWAVAGACGCGRGHTGNDIGKAPLVKWTDFQTRRATVEEATQWWTNWPHANIACVTGAISGLVVVDLEHEGLDEAERLELWSPLKAYTGKGYHLYFSHPGEGRICNAAKMKKIRGFDMRGDGGYVLLPPSRHATGRLYSWASASSVGAPLPVFPKQLFADITKPSSLAGTSEKLAKPEGWIADALGGLSDGNRNSTFTSIVGKLHSQRWGATDIRSLLLPHALRVQFSEAELDTVIRSVARYPVSLRPNSTIRPTTGGTGQPSGDMPPAKLAVYTLDKNWDDYQRAKAGTKTSEFPTGYPRFDKLIGGGLQSEELLTVAAWTGVGKTNWLLGLCRTLCGKGKRVLLLSTEMSRRKIWDRYISLVGSEEEARKHALIISDEFIPNPAAIRDAIAEHKPDVFIFDHIHNVSEENAEVGAYIKALKQYALEFKIPGVVAAQFNKDADWRDDDGERIPPRMSMIKGASTIIQVSAQILLLDERDDTPEQKDILGVLDKNRDGEKGLVAFTLKKKPYRMEEA